MGGRFGKVILTFQVSSPGIYPLRASSLLDTRWILSTVAISLALFFGSLIIAAALVITVFKRRHHAQERLREEERLIRVNGPLIERDFDDASLKIVPFHK